jgi:hypothetical protein
MDAITIPDVWSGQDRTLTVQDMENMPDDEFRYELDDGMLIASPARSTLHQFAVARLTVILSAACPAGLVVLPGVDVNINKFQRPSRADRLRASFGRTRADRSCHRRRGVPRGGPVPGSHCAAPARNGWLIISADL